MEEEEKSAENDSNSNMQGMDRSVNMEHTRLLLSRVSQ